MGKSREILKEFIKLSTCPTDSNRFNLSLV